MTLKTRDYIHSNPTKIVFLDIDGPLATNDCFDEGRFILSTGASVPYKWNQDACNRLQSLLDVTKAKVIISSDWRLHYGLDELKELFWHYSMNGEAIIGVTGQYHPSKFSEKGYLCSGRSNEIYEIVQNYKLSHWVAIDDMPLLVPRFVHITDTAVGFNSDELSDQALKLLTQP